LKPIINVIQALSIEVALGAVFSSYFFASLLGNKLPIYYYLPLFCTVWIIYTIDHLADALRKNIILYTFRHRFHLKHKKVLAFALVIATIITVIMVIKFYPPKILMAGLSLLFYVLLYLLTAQIEKIRKKIPLYKELCSAIGYTAGVLLLPVFLSEKIQNNNILILSVISFFLIALSNLLLFSYYDAEVDKRQQQYSTVFILGPKKIRVLIGMNLLLSFLLNGIIFFISEDIVFIIILFLMNITLYIILFYASYFKKNDRFRFLGDGVFLYPIVLILL